MFSVCSRRLTFSLTVHSGKSRVMQHAETGAPLVQLQEQIVYPFGHTYCGRFHSHCWYGLFLSCFYGWYFEVDGDDLAFEAIGCEFFLVTDCPFSVAFGPDGWIVSRVGWCQEGWFVISCYLDSPSIFCFGSIGFHRFVLDEFLVMICHLFPIIGWFWGWRMVLFMAGWLYQDSFKICVLLQRSRLCEPLDLHGLWLYGRLLSLLRWHTNATIRIPISTSGVLQPV